jgi:hypothetical protein
MLQDLILSSTTPTTKTVTLLVAEGKEDVSFRVAIDEDESELLSNEKIVDNTPVDSSKNLGLSRQMARYFGGELEQVKMGSCTNTYLHIKRKDGKERIPPVLETMHTNIFE